MEKKEPINRLLALAGVNKDSPFLHEKFKIINKIDETNIENIAYSLNKKLLNYLCDRDLSECDYTEWNNKFVFLYINQKLYIYNLEKNELIDDEAEPLAPYVLYAEVEQKKELLQLLHLFKHHKELADYILVGKTVPERLYIAEFVYRSSYQKMIKNDLVNNTVSVFLDRQPPKQLLFEFIDKFLYDKLTLLEKQNILNLFLVCLENNFLNKLSKHIIQKLFMIIMNQNIYDKILDKLILYKNNLQKQIIDFLINVPMPVQDAELDYEIESDNLGFLYYNFKPLHFIIFLKKIQAQKLIQYCSQGIIDCSGNFINMIVIQCNTCSELYYFVDTDKQVIFNKQGKTVHYSEVFPYLSNKLLEFVINKMKLSENFKVLLYVTDNKLKKSLTEYLYNKKYNLKINQNVMQDVLRFVKNNIDETEYELKKYIKQLI